MIGCHAGVAYSRRGRTRLIDPLRESRENGAVLNLGSADLRQKEAAPLAARRAGRTGCRRWPG